MKEEVTEVYEKEEDINRLCEKLRAIQFDDLIKTEHFEYSIDEKGTDLAEIKENFRKFEKVKMINQRRHASGKISYDFYYELEDGTYLIYALILEEKPLLINAFHVSRSFKSFKKHLMKAYKDSLIG
jgi:hypothetical protein